MVEHYVEEVSKPDHLRFVSDSDVFTPTGRIKVGVIWDRSVKKIDDHSCEFMNTVHSSATPELSHSRWMKKGTILQGGSSKGKRINFFCILHL